jgi:cell division septation protein DedD
MRTRRRWTTDRIISAGLAVTACAGIVGVIGVRSIEDSAAAQQTSPAEAAASATEVLSSAGLTEAQLDEYAAQLQAQAARLDAYRVKLTKAAKAVASAPQPAAKKSPRPGATNPVAKPAPKPAPKPQSTTKSS